VNLKNARCNNKNILNGVFVVFLKSSKPMHRQRLHQATMISFSSFPTHHSVTSPSTSHATSHLETLTRHKAHSFTSHKPRHQPGHQQRHQPRHQPLRDTDTPQSTLLHKPPAPQSLNTFTAFYGNHKFTTMFAKAQQLYEIRSNVGTIYQTVRCHNTRNKVHSLRCKSLKSHTYQPE
jgi:hypothetical protein